MKENPDLIKDYPDGEFVQLLFLSKALDLDISTRTHPIRVPVQNTREGVDIFDPISYEKGASWIKQMDSYVGRETLSKAMKLYFEKNSWKACEFEDFVSCIEEAAKNTPRGKNFRKWVDSWLLKAGANSLSSSWEENSDGTFTFSVS